MKEKKCSSFIFISLLLVLGSLLIIGCSKKKKEDKLAETVEKKTMVRIARVKVDQIEETVSLVGDIYGQREVKVYPKVNGKLTKKIRDEGDLVKEEETVALVDRNEPALDFAPAEVKAPLSGIITKYFADLGDEVFPAQPMAGQPLLTIAEIDKVKVEVHLSEKDSGKVKKEQKARVTIDACPEKAFSGQVSEIAPQVNPLTRKSKVEIEVNNQEHLIKPGMFARVEIITREDKGILVVPLKAVLDKEKQKVVFIIRENKAKMVPVETGVSDEENMEIKKGLGAGEKVIVEGNYGLLEGTEVEVVK